MKRVIAISIASMIFSGCQSSSTENKPAASTATSAASPATTADAVKKESGHEHSAPHGGTLVELGEEFAHLEVVLDAATGKLTIYVLDGEAEKAVRIKQNEIEITTINPAAVIKLSGVANSLTGETANDTSEFAGQSNVLKGASSFDGVIRAVMIKGRQFKGVAFNFPKDNEKK